MIASNPVQVCHAFSQKYTDLSQGGYLYVKIVGKLNPSSRRKLAGMAQELVLQERLSPSISSRQLLSRVQAAESSAVQDGSFLCPLNAGGDVAAMCALIILMLVQDDNQDLQAQMAQAEAQMAAKEALRTLLNEVSRIQAALAGGSYTSAQCSAAMARIQSKWTLRH